MDMNCAYVAGLIDGEGCIHLDVDRRHSTYRARVTVGMTEPALSVLTALKEEWGGTLYQMRAANARWAAAWTWHLTGPPAVRLLRAIQPYLRIKCEQAAAALEVEAVRDSLPSQANGHKRWNPGASAQCQEIKTRMHRMNAKGPRAPAPTAEAV
jgi:hypothetical protein